MSEACEGRRALCMFDVCRHYVARVVDGYEPLLPLFDKPAMSVAVPVTAASVAADTPFDTNWDRDITIAWFAKVFGPDEGPKFAEALLSTDKKASRPALLVFRLDIDDITEKLDEVISNERHRRVQAKAIHRAIHPDSKPTQGASESQPLIQGHKKSDDDANMEVRFNTGRHKFKGWFALGCLTLIIAAILVPVGLTRDNSDQVLRWGVTGFGLSMILFSILFFAFHITQFKVKRD